MPALTTTETCTKAQLTSPGASSTLGDDAIVLQYEELVSNPAANMQKLCQLLELPYEDRMPHYGDQDEFRGRFGDQIGIRRHQAPVTDSIVKWMKDLLDPEVCKMARQYLDHLGAPLYCPKWATPTTN